MAVFKTILYKLQRKDKYTSTIFFNQICLNVNLMSFSDPVLIFFYKYLFVCLHVTGSMGKGALMLEDEYYENDVSGPEARGRKFTCHRLSSQLRAEILKLRWDTT